MTNSILDQAYTFEQFLEHAGVKGMKWGVRKEPDRIQQINKRLKQIDRYRHRPTLTTGMDVLSGAGARAGSAKSVMKYDKVVETIDGQRFERLVPSAKTPEITDANRAQFNRKINRHAYTKYATHGALTVAALIGTGTFANKKITDPTLRRNVMTTSFGMAVLQAVHTTKIISGIHRSIKLEQIGIEQRQLERELRKLESQNDG